MAKTIPAGEIMVKHGPKTDNEYVTCLTTDEVVSHFEDLLSKGKVLGKDFRVFLPNDDLRDEITKKLNEIQARHTDPVEIDGVISTKG
ncbi:MAG: hypothetical protein HDQ88_11100 [Clostridia bacterium]|nr:hypothetical protein [Clostridia bacterium]